MHDLATRVDGRVTVEHLDIDKPDDLALLHERLAHERTPIGAVPTADFVEVMITNALRPRRVMEALEDLVSPTGLIGAMPPGQGSIANNTTAGREVYRGSKAALNMFMRSFAVRQAGTQRAFVLLAPGWIRTALGGPEAPFTIEESVPLLVDVLLSRLGTPGLAYLDRSGQSVPW